MPLQDEERLFIEAIRDLNYQASLLHAEEEKGNSALSTSDPPQASEMSAADSIVLGVEEAAMKAKIAHSHVSVCSSTSPHFKQDVSWIQSNISKLKSKLDHGDESRFSDPSTSTDEETPGGSRGASKKKAKRNEV